MRLIDADAFKEYICNAYEQVKHMYPDGGEWARQITEDFCKDIDEQPTIEPHPTQLTDEDKETIRIHLSAFKEKLCNQHRWNEAEEYEELISRLLSTPSVQPEGIRCKDCKHWMMGKTTKNYPNPYICELHSFMHGFERSALPEDYCSWAELRGDSDDR